MDSSFDLRYSFFIKKFDHFPPILFNNPKARLLNKVSDVFKHLYYHETVLICGVCYFYKNAMIYTITANHFLKTQKELSHC